MLFLTYGLYVLSIVLSLFTIGFAISINVSYSQKYMVAFLMCAAIQNIGYLAQIISYTKEAAWLGLRFQFLGICFALLFVCRYICYYYKYEIKRSFFVALGVCDFLVLALVWTDELNHLFYKSVDFVTTGEHPHLIISRGFGFVFFCLFCILVPLYVIFRALYEYRKDYPQKLTKKQIVFYLFTTVCCIFVFVNYIFKISFYNFAPIFLNVFLCMIVLFIWKSNDRDINHLGSSILMEHMQELVVMIDYNGKIISYNDKFDKAFGELKDKLINSQTLAYLKSGMGENKVFPYSKGNYTYNISYRSVRDRKGTLIGFVCIFYDISRLQDNIIQLKELKERADNANRTKQLFLSSMSHEIRTPMNTILGATEILKGTNLTPEQKDYISSVETAGQTLVTIINDLINVSELETKKVSLIEKEYDFYALLHDIETIFLTKIGDKPIELLFELDPTIPRMLVGDENRVRQILIHILQNAVKYTQKGYVKLTCKCVQKAFDIVSLEFEVTDTGCGIKNESLQKILGIFSNKDTNKDDRTASVGVGLSVCRAFLEKMNGGISMKSTFLVGSSVVFSFEQIMFEPEVFLKQNKMKRFVDKHETCSIVTNNMFVRNSFEKNAELLGWNYIDCDLAYLQKKKIKHLVFEYGIEKDEKNKKFFDIEREFSYLLINSVLQSMEEIDKEKGIYANAIIVKKPFHAFTFHYVDMKQQKKKVVSKWTAEDVKVLLVDDNEVNLKVAQSLLKRTKVSIDIAKNGQEALERVDEKEYDLILMDHMMPIMDGIEATLEMRKSDSIYKQQVPIVALTANAVVGAREKFLESGMDDFVSKPIQLPLLLDAMERCLPNSLLHYE